LRARRLAPNFSLTRFGDKEPYKHPADREHLLDGLKTMKPPSLSNLFIRWRDRLGLSKEATLHGARHLFIQRAEAVDIPLLTIQRIVGHSTRSVTGDTYGKADLAVLRKAIRRIRYPGLIVSSDPGAAPSRE
jgi:integrase